MTMGAANKTTGADILKTSTGRGDIGGALLPDGSMTLSTSQDAS